MAAQVDIMIMSGAWDGTLFSFSSEAGHGVWENGAWAIRIGRDADNDLCLKEDEFSSRHHARLLCWRDGLQLQDQESRNKTYIDMGEDDKPLERGATAALQLGQLFRVGRTWMRIERLEMS